MKDSVLDAMRRHFRPEFLNRVDEIIVFHALTVEDLKKIVDIQLERLRRRLEERRITLELSEEAKAHLARAGYDPVYGARPLKRSIQREIETPLSRLILKGEVKDNTVVRAEVEGDSIAFTTRPVAAGAEASK
jgi:ATP-dependent Clp protease ATP-binding subunit ClpB